MASWRSDKRLPAFSLPPPSPQAEGFHSNLRQEQSADPVALSPISGPHNLGWQLLLLITPQEQAQSALP